MPNALMPFIIQVKRTLIHIVFIFIISAILNVALAIGFAQFQNRPPCSISYAQDYAVRKIFTEPRPVPPIWPEFEERGIGVSIVGVNPEQTPLSRSGADGYIIVTLSAGWPLRCFTARTQYLLGGWGPASPTLKLLSRPVRSGKPIQRELPLSIRWREFLANSISILLIWRMPWWTIRALRRRFRKRRNMCPRCAYPIGTNEVCTECGERL